MDKLKIGILGTADIAREFMAGIRLSQKADVVAIASRTLDKAEAFASEFEIGKAYAAYDALLADVEIDAIYNPLPNTLHAEWSIRAAEAGKHVLCEKPLTPSAIDATAIFEAAQKNSVHIVEAYPYLAQPQTIRLRQLLDEGAIGRVRLVRASIGFSMSDRDNIRLDPALAGGSLLDAGSYPVSLVRVIAGERATRTYAVADWTETGVDRSMVATLEHAGGLLAQIACSFGTGVHRHALISGDEGVIETSYSNHTSPERPAVLQLRRGTSWSTAYETISLPEMDGFLAEIDSFADLISIGSPQWSGATPEQSVDIARTLEAIIASARAHIPIDL